MGTGRRFTRYYTRNEVYRLEGAPQIAMRLLAPLLVAATVVLFASGDGASATRSATAAVIAAPSRLRR